MLLVSRIKRFIRRFRRAWALMDEEEYQTAARAVAILQRPLYTREMRRAEQE